MFSAPGCAHGVGGDEVDEKVVGEREARKWGLRYGVGHVFIWRNSNSSNWGEKTTLDQ